MFVVHIFSRMFESPSLDLSQITDSTALSMSKNFLHNTIRTTIGGLKDFFEVKIIDILKIDFIYE